MSTIDGQEKVLACKEHIVNQVNKSFGQSAQFHTRARGGTEWGEVHIAGLEKTSHKSKNC